jgi:hypothetical protein
MGGGAQIGRLLSVLDGGATDYCCCYYYYCYYYYYYYYYCVRYEDKTSEGKGRKNSTRLICSYLLVNKSLICYFGPLEGCIS